jgi:uncharacterized protein with FMN-binding domain
MLSKRFFLIAGGTVTGLGAVLSITPPQFGASTSLGSGSLGTGASLSGGTTATPAATPTPTTTKKATTGGVKTTPKATHTATPAPVTTPKAAGVSGTFTGATASTIYGPVQVQITIVNGKITSASAPIYPTSSFRDQQINSQAIPLLVQETLAAQSANIQGVGGASYTSQGWFTSLSSALAKAGL